MTFDSEKSIKKILGIKTKILKQENNDDEYFEEDELYCFECGKFIPKKDWLLYPPDNYGCSRHL